MKQHYKIHKSGGRGPHHRTYHRRVKHALAFIILAAWLGLGVLSGIIFARYYRHHNELVQSPTSRVAWSIVSWRFDPGHSAIFPAPTGYKFVIIDLKLDNNSKDTYNFAPVLQTDLRDSAGSIYEVSPTELATPFKAGKLEPGLSTEGELSYLVPTYTTGLQFRLQLEYPNGAIQVASLK